MTIEKGMYFKHNNRPDWGVGLIHSIKEGKAKVIFESYKPSFFNLTHLENLVTHVDPPRDVMKKLKNVRIPKEELYKVVQQPKKIEPEIENMGPSFDDELDWDILSQ